MRPLLISTSRADWSGLGMVAKEFLRRGIGVSTFLTGIEPVEESVALADGLQDTDTARLVPDDAPHRGPFNRFASLMGRLLGPVLRNNLASSAEGYRPDIAILVGDRFETLMVAQACIWHGIPIAHIAGGDRTDGSKDDLYRYAITSLSQIHFVTNSLAHDSLLEYRVRASRICQSGSPAIDRLMTMKRIPRGELYDRFGFDPSKSFAVVNWQAVTNGNDDGLVALLHELMGYDLNLVLVGANPEPSSEDINTRLLAFCVKHQAAQFCHSLPPEVYLSLIAEAKFLAGNSSSGYHEAPYFGTPVVDISTRQKGRIVSRNIFLAPEASDVSRAIGRAYNADRSDFVGLMPYGDGTAAQRIVDRLCAITDFPGLFHGR